MHMPLEGGARFGILARSTSSRGRAFSSGSAGRVFSMTSSSVKISVIFLHLDCISCTSRRPCPRPTCGPRSPSPCTRGRRPSCRRCRSPGNPSRRLPWSRGGAGATAREGSRSGSLILDHLDELVGQAEVLVLLDGLELLDRLDPVAVLAEGDDLLEQDFRRRGAAGQAERLHALEP